MLRLSPSSNELKRRGGIDRVGCSVDAEAPPVGDARRVISLATLSVMASVPVGDSAVDALRW